MSAYPYQLKGQPTDPAAIMRRIRGRYQPIDAFGMNVQLNATFGRLPNVGNAMRGMEGLQLAIHRFALPRQSAYDLDRAHY